MLKNTCRAIQLPLQLLVSCLLFMLSAAQARQIHNFHVICDAYPGSAGKINRSVSVDGMCMEDVFTQYVNAKSWGITQRLVTVEGEEATKESILRQWNEFAKNIGRDDTVFVYFSGHGALPEGKPYDEMILQTCDLQFISRKAWADSIQALPCKLKILITDCCSSFVSKELAEGDAEVEPWNNLYYLLLKHEGFVNITAASPGQAAIGTSRGSYLTVNLISDMQRFRTWDEVFRQSSSRVHEEVTDLYKSTGDPLDTAQRPYSYGLAKPLFDPADAGGESDPENHFVISDSDRRKITPLDLEPLGLQQLYFARNEIFARHGFDFSTPLLKFYFKSRDWYEVRPGFKNPEFSAIERQNIDLILAVEKSKGGPFVSAKIILPGESQVPAPDIFSYSSKKLLTRPALEKLSTKELSIARNEIFARHGFPFESNVLRSFFLNKGTYRPNPAATSPSFNAIEQQNLWLIRKLERINGGAYKW